MKSFSLSFDQLTRIIGALIAEELRRGGNRQADILSATEWTDETKFDSVGIDLSTEEYDLCKKRVETFFGCIDQLPEKDLGNRLGDWSRSVEQAIFKNFTSVTFRPAGRGSEDANCTHQTDKIFADAAAATNLFHGRRRLLSLVAPHSLMGFVLTVLTPNLQKIPTLDVRNTPPNILQSTLQFGDVLVATPTLWRYILQQNISAPDNTMCVFFGEPMPPDLSADMRQAGFGAQREIYGSTEDGLIGWRDSPTEQFILFDHWCRDGEKLTRVIGKDEKLSILPMDNLSWSDDRRFTLSGRRDGAVQIGAVNVFPDKIAETLRSEASVEDCVIRISRHQRGVNRLVAHIILKSEIMPTEATVRIIDQFCRTNLRSQERPSIFHFESSLENVS